MTEELTYEEITATEQCPECENKAPKRQIDNIGMCERCSMEGKIKTDDGKTRDPENNLLDRYKMNTTDTGDRRWRP